MIVKVCDGPHVRRLTVPDACSYFELQALLTTICGYSPDRIAFKTESGEILVGCDSHVRDAFAHATPSKPVRLYVFPKVAREEHVSSSLRKAAHLRSPSSSSSSAASPTSLSSSIIFPSPDELHKNSVSDRLQAIMRFVQEVKAALGANSATFSQFLDTLSELKVDSPTSPIVQRVNILLRDHSHLVAEFRKFVRDPSHRSLSPASNTSTSTPHAELASPGLDPMEAELVPSLAVATSMAEAASLESTATRSEESKKTVHEVAKRCDNGAVAQSQREPVRVSCVCPRCQADSAVNLPLVCRELLTGIGSLKHSIDELRSSAVELQNSIHSLPSVLASELLLLGGASPNRSATSAARSEWQNVTASTEVGAEAEGHDWNHRSSTASGALLCSSPFLVSPSQREDSANSYQQIASPRVSDAASSELHFTRPAHASDASLSLAPTGDACLTTSSIQMPTTASESALDVAASVSLESDVDAEFDSLESSYSPETFALLDALEREGYSNRTFSAVLLKMHKNDIDKVRESLRTFFQIRQ